MRDVAVVGAGMTEFGDHTGRTIKDLGSDACYEAMTDAGTDPEDIEYASCGNFASGLFGYQGNTVGQVCLREVGVTGIPIVNVENGGSTGATAFQDAWRAVASGSCDVAVAFGVEKMCGVDTGEMLEVMSNAGDKQLEGANGITWPALFAMVARRRMHEEGTTRELMAQVAVNHYDNARKNPLAQRHLDLTVEDVLDSPVVADPLTLYDCCPTSDGAGAVVLASEDVATTYADDPVWVLAAEQSSGEYRDDRNLARAPVIADVAADAFDTAGVEPSDVDLVEYHDAFTIEEPIYLEELGFCDPGEGDELIAEGYTSLDGEVPFCPSGGLLARGHPVGATGLAQICEVVWQLRGEAGDRQIADATVGLVQVIGTFLHTDNGCSNVILFGT